MQSYTFPNGKTIKNTLVMAPMTTYSSNKDEFFSDKELRYYERRSQDVGLLITGALSVSVDGHGFFNHVSLDTDRNIARFEQFAKTLKNHGATVIAQLIHAGKLALPTEIGEHDVLAPSAVPSKRRGFAMPHDMTEVQAKRIIDDFYEATKRAIRAGFDGIEIHGANGYLLQQFVSPYSNRRTDKWGGTVENRLSFPLAVVRAVQRAINELKPGRFIVGYRLSPEEPGDMGISVADTKQLIDALIQSKVDYIHFSLKKYNQVGKRTETEHVEMGRELIRFIDGRTTVIGVGGIKSMSDVNSAHAIGYDLVAIGTALMMEPRFGKMIMADRHYKFRFSPLMLLHKDLPRGLLRFMMQTIQEQIMMKLDFKR